MIVDTMPRFRHFFRVLIRFAAFLHMLPPCRHCHAAAFATPLMLIITLMALLMMIADTMMPHYCR